MSDQPKVVPNDETHVFIRNRKQLVSDIASALNKNCAENESDTPDFILAEYLVGCLESYETCKRANERWYGVPGPSIFGNRTL